MQALAAQNMEVSPDNDRGLDLSEEPVGQKSPPVQLRIGHMPQLQAFRIRFHLDHGGQHHAADPERQRRIERRHGRAVAVDRINRLRLHDHGACEKRRKLIRISVKHLDDGLQGFVVPQFLQPLRQFVHGLLQSFEQLFDLLQRSVERVQRPVRRIQNRRDLSHRVVDALQQDLQHVQILNHVAEEIGHGLLQVVVDEVPHLSDAIDDIPAQDGPVLRRKPRRLQRLILGVNLLQLCDQMIDGRIHRAGRGRRAAAREAGLHPLQVLDQGVVLLDQRVDFRLRQIPVGESFLHLGKPRLKIPYPFQHLLFGIGDGFFRRLDAVCPVLQAEIREIVSRFMHSSAQNDVVDLELLHELTVLAELVSGFGQKPDHIVHALVRINVLDEFIDAREQIVDQNSEITHLDVMLRGGCGRFGDLVGNGVRLRVLPEGDRRRLIIESLRNAVHVAGQVFSQYQGAVVFPGAHTLHRFFIVCRNPVDAGTCRHLLDDFLPLVPVFPGFQGIALVPADQRDRDVSGPPVRVPVGENIEPGIQGGNHADRNGNHKGKKLSED